MKALNKILNDEKTFTMFMPLKVKDLLWGFTSPFIKKLESLIPSFIKKLLPELNINPFISLQVMVCVYFP